MCIHLKSTFCYNIEFLKWKCIEVSWHACGFVHNWTCFRFLREVRQREFCQTVGWVQPRPKLVFRHSCQKLKNVCHIHSNIKSQSQVSRQCVVGWCQVHCAHSKHDWIDVGKNTSTKHESVFFLDGHCDLDPVSYLAVSRRDWLLWYTKHLWRRYSSPYWC